jgi:protocatechuate 3,4-dioxygenase beta subunit
MHDVMSLVIAVSMSQAAAPAANGRISGRVTAEGTNAPIAGARVMVFPMFRGPVRPAGPVALPTPAITDQDGRFVFNSVAAGEYRLDVQKTGYASPQDPTSPKTYTLTAGQSLDVSITLLKGAVISGKLLDQKGEPVSDARVVALRKMPAVGRSNAPTRLIPAAMQGLQQTNDLGEYRLTGLLPGEYYVAASPHAMGFGGPGTSSTTGSGGGALTTTTTYYPGTADQAGAQPIAVTAGAEVPNIVFGLQAVPAYRISGIVVDEAGAPIARAMVMVMSDPKTGMMFMGPGGNAQTDENGRFTIGDVVPGTYRVSASVPMMMTSGGSAGATSVSTSGGVNSTTWSVTTSNGVTTTMTTNGAPPQPQEVVVADADVRGVRVVARRPPTPPQ